MTSFDLLRQTWNEIRRSWRRLAGVALLALPALGAAASQDDSVVAAHLGALTAELPEPARQALAGIDTPQRKLLAVRSYVKAGPQLQALWSWTAEEVRRFERSRAYQRLLVAVDAVKRQFEHQNPGYSLYANMQVRTLELQLERWNANAGVARVGDELYRATQRELRTRHYPERPNAASLERLKRFLVGWYPRSAAPLAAPGLSAHGQLRAIDFQVMRGKQIIAGTSIASVRTAWEQPGWHERLRRAVRSADAQFVGPLRAPNEPWHYTYVPAEQTADTEAPDAVRCRRDTEARVTVAQSTDSARRPSSCI